jgi:hypothetical protein
MDYDEFEVLFEKMILAEKSYCERADKMIAYYKSKISKLVKLKREVRTSNKKMVRMRKVYDRKHNKNKEVD